MGSVTPPVDSRFDECPVGLDAELTDGVRVGITSPFAFWC